MQGARVDETTVDVSVGDPGKVSVTLVIVLDQAAFLAQHLQELNKNIVSKFRFGELKPLHQIFVKFC